MTTEDLVYLLSLKERMAAGDNLGLTLPERDELTLRIMRAESEAEADRAETFNRLTNPNAYHRPLREFKGTSDENGTTKTLAALGFAHGKVAPEFRDGMEALGSHLDAALDADSLSAARRHVRKARDVHVNLVKELD